jgi:protein-L-isoaspartate(D-aspartate) O-methyltransferase
MKKTKVKKSNIRKKSNYRKRSSKKRIVKKTNIKKKSSFKKGGGIGSNITAEQYSNMINQHNALIFDRSRNFKNYKNLVNSLVGRCLLPREFKEHFLKVDRLKYLQDKTRKYNDSPSGIEAGQTISAPHLHAFALKELKPVLKKGAHVLDVGCGSGFLTAVFSYIVGVDRDKGKVVGIDIHQTLVDFSKKNILENNPGLSKDANPGLSKDANPRLSKDANPGLSKDAKQLKDNLIIVEGNGWEGYPQNQKELYDAIHVGAEADKLPEKLWDQLKPGGIMVIPIKNSESTKMMIYQKPVFGERLCNYRPCNVKESIGVRFVPLVTNLNHVKNLKKKKINQSFV